MSPCSGEPFRVPIGVTGDAGVAGEGDCCTCLYRAERIASASLSNPSSTTGLIAEAGAAKGSGCCWPDPEDVGGGVGQAGGAKVGGPKTGGDGAGCPEAGVLTAPAGGCVGVIAGVACDGVAVNGVACDGVACDGVACDGVACDGVPCGCFCCDCCWLLLLLLLLRGRALSGRSNENLRRPPWLPVGTP